MNRCPVRGAATRRPRGPVLCLAIVVLFLLPCCAVSDAGPAGSAAFRWRESKAEYQDLSLRVRVAGHGEATILLLHGLAGSSRYFGEAFDALAEQGRVVVPDLLGFGGSRRPAVSYDADQHARAVLEVLDGLGVRGPVYIAGHSAGSLVALRVAGLRPWQVRGVIAFGPPFYASPDEARAHVAGVGWSARIFFLDRWLSRAACFVMCVLRGPAARVATWLRPDVPAPVARDAVRHSWRSYSGTLHELIFAAQPPRDLATLKQPVWLIAGDRDRIVDFEFARQLARQDRVRFEVWPGGHDLPLTAPGRCLDAIRRLIATASASAE